MDLSKYITNKLMSIISRRSDGISVEGEGGVAFFLIRFGRDRRSFSIDSLHLYQSLTVFPSLLRNSSLHSSLFVKLNLGMSMQTHLDRFFVVFAADTWR